MATNGLPGRHYAQVSGKLAASPMDEASVGPRVPPWPEVCHDIFRASPPNKAK